MEKGHSEARQWAGTGCCPQFVEGSGGAQSVFAWEAAVQEGRSVRFGHGRCTSFRVVRLVVRVVSCDGREVWPLPPCVAPGHGARLRLQCAEGLGPVHLTPLSLSPGLLGKHFSFSKSHFLSLQVAGGGGHRF